MKKGEPFTGTFKLDKETKNTVRYAEEAEGRRPVVGTVYVDRYELPKPFPKRIRVAVEPVVHFLELGKIRLGLEREHLVDGLFHDLGRDVLKVVFGKVGHTINL